MYGGIAFYDKEQIEAELRKPHGKNLMQREDKANE